MTDCEKGLRRPVHENARLSCVCVVAVVVPKSAARVRRNGKLRSPSIYTSFLGSSMIRANSVRARDTLAFIVPNGTLQIWAASS